MLLPGYCPRAPNAAPFSFRIWLAGLFFGCWAAGGAAAPTDCKPSRTDERVTVAHVHDGDTLRLADDRRVRLIGVDTPELRRDGHPAQPLAIEARDTLRAMIKPGDTLFLHYDEERYDRYGRTLAHAYLDNGASVEAQLLQEGLAATLTIPPNTGNLACYQAAEREARQRRRGIWSRPEYQPVAAASLTGHEQGFRLVTGKITQISDDNGDRLIRLEDKITLRISRKYMGYFATSLPGNLVGRAILARGQLHSDAGGSEIYIKIRHPSALQVIE
ncbi:MAG: thermonuclease family protein [Gammaproteobacteria bacterium]|nr:thermonuclease family protein [Gammaproteobacteria bacterium]